MKTFLGIRPNTPLEYIEKGITNGPDRPDYQGCIFDDGVVALRWLTLNGSTSIFNNYDEFYTIHDHPEYGTEIRFYENI